jgi:type VI protein secretion system component VasF
MGFNPGTGMTPNDWAETEARREERMQRADRPHGREMSGRSRRVTGWILALAALALVVYAVLGWLDVIPVPGING